MASIPIGERVKVVFVDGNFSEGKVTTKRGVVKNSDEHYLYLSLDNGNDIIQIGHNFIVKVIPEVEVPG